MTRKQMSIDYSQFVELRRLYRDAVANDLTEFKFEGETLVVDYAKYMIEFLAEEFDKIQNISDEFREVKGVPHTDGQIEQLAKSFNIPAEEMRRKLNEDAKRYTLHVNKTYQVAKYTDNPEITHLSIKRLDQEIIFDWRAMQDIKTQLVGPECEGVQIFPAESRLVDTANQYHMWVFTDPDFRLPFGFNDGRVVKDDISMGKSGAKQRPLEDNDS